MVAKSVKYHKDLGVDSCGGRKRRVEVQRERFRKATQRTRRLTALQHFVKNNMVKLTRRVFNIGVAPVATYGATIFGVKCSFIA